MQICHFDLVFRRRRKSTFTVAFYGEVVRIVYILGLASGPSELGWSIKFVYGVHHLANEHKVISDIESIAIAHVSPLRSYKCDFIINTVFC